MSFTSGGSLGFLDAPRQTERSHRSPQGWDPIVTVVCVHGPLRKLAGGESEHPLPGATVGALLRALELEHPALAGWVLDERGLIRRHINVYVNGEPGGEATAVQRHDRVEVLPAISGG